MTRLKHLFRKTQMNKNEIQKDWDTITYIIEKKRRAMRYYFSIGEVMQIREIKKKYSF